MLASKADNSTKVYDNLVSESLIYASDKFFFSCKKIGEVFTTKKGWLGIGIGRTAFPTIVWPMAGKIISLTRKNVNVGNVRFGFTNSYRLFCNFPMILIVAPVLEEYIFRGFFQTTIENDYKYRYSQWDNSHSFTPIVAKVVAIFLSSVLFGLAHCFNLLTVDPKFVLIQVITASILGIFLGSAKELSGSLKVPIGMHFFHNFAAMAMYLRRFAETVKIS